MNQSFGALPFSKEATSFSVWAPFADKVFVVAAGQEHQLDKGDDQCFRGIIDGVKTGDTYRYRIDNGAVFPDPVSRFQPEGVHGPSQVIDPDAFDWTDHDWNGIASTDLVIYEIHVGTFTDEGTFRSAIDRLDELIELGVTALEIMPVAECPGRWNWGYDGVSFFAPSHNYGTPEAFKELINTCHERGIAVILDVVYNHIGPEGNYLANFAPYISKKHRTPWGDAFNFDGEHSEKVRDYIRDNVEFWLTEYHLDGLRLDAVRFMQDDSETSIVDDIARDAEVLEKALNRKLHLIGESCVYDGALLESGFDAVWSDEIPHAILGLLLNQTEVAEREYRGFDDLSESLETGFLYEWRDGNIFRPEPKQKGRLNQIIHGLQTHDQVGNHPLGHRVSEMASPAEQRAAAALVLLYPAIPFIFMGEEFATPSPFCFFVDFGDTWLRDGVIEGRKRDYQHHNWVEFVSPLDETTFLKSKLPTSEAGDELTLRWYKELLKIRRSWIEQGRLKSRHLRVDLVRESGLVTLRYSDHWVAVRLGEKGDESVVDLRGDILLHSADVLPGRPTLGINEAAVGRD